MRRWIAVITLTAMSLADAPAQSTIFGAGTAGDNGFVPLHTANGPWIGNGAFRMSLDKGLGGSTGFYFLSLGEAAIPFKGGHLLIDPSPTKLLAQFPVPLSPGGAGQGAVSVPVPIPNQSALVGLKFFSQVLVAQPNGKIVLSNGLQHEISLGPEVFLGCSIAGSTDPYQVVDINTFAIVDSGGNGCSDNVTDAVFIHGGRDLFAASAFGDICAADATGPLNFNSLFSSVGGGGSYGLAHDARNDHLWTMCDVGTGRELVAIDPSGGLSFATSGAFGGTSLVEIWDLSPTSRIAAVTTFFPTNLILLDTDPTSAGYGNPLLNVPVPLTATIAIVTDVAITPDEQFVIMTIQNAGGPSEIARFHLPSMSFWDHDPTTGAIDHIGAFSLPPAPIPDSATSIDLSSNGAFAVVCGIGNCGWTGRLDFSLSDPAAFSFTPWQVGSGMPNTWTIDLSPDDSLVATASWNASGCPSFSGQPTLYFVDPVTGAVLGSTNIPLNSNSSTLQNLYTVRFR